MTTAPPNSRIPPVMGLGVPKSVLFPDQDQALALAAASTNEPIKSDARNFIDIPITIQRFV